MSANNSSDLPVVSDRLSKNAMRNVSERLIEGLLMMAAAVSVLTTLGIVYVLVSESIHFFTHVSVVYFLTDTQWTPLFDYRSVFGKTLLRAWRTPEEREPACAILLELGGWRLGSAIRLGLLAPGAQLPAERELAQQLGVSRNVLREALRSLELAGLVEARTGATGGFFIRSSRMKTSLRVAMAPYVVWMARTLVPSEMLFGVLSRATRKAGSRLMFRSVWTAGGRYRSVSVPNEP